MFNSKIESVLGEDAILGTSSHSLNPFRSGFDDEHPMPSYDELRNAGFSDHVANNILYGDSHVYSEKELFQCLYGSEDPLQAYNDMMEEKVRQEIDKTEKIIKDTEKEFGIKI